MEIDLPRIGDIGCLLLEGFLTPSYLKTRQDSVRNDSRSACHLDIDAFSMERSIRLSPISSLRDFSHRDTSSSFQKTKSVFSFIRHDSRVSIRKTMAGLSSQTEGIPHPPNLLHLESCSGQLLPNFLAKITLDLHSIAFHRTPCPAFAFQLRGQPAQFLHWHTNPVITVTFLPLRPLVCREMRMIPSPLGRDGCFFAGTFRHRFPHPGQMRPCSVE